MAKKATKQKKIAYELEKLARFEDNQRKRAKKRNLITIIACSVAAFAVLITLAITVPQIASKNDASSEAETSSDGESSTASEDGSNIVDGITTPEIDFNAEVPTIKMPPTYEGSDKLEVKVLQEGEGDVIDTSKDSIEVNYSGWNAKGNEFDSNIDPAKGHVAPFTVNPGGVIQGWLQGLNGQKVGSKLMLQIPNELAYPEKPASQLESDPSAPAGALVFYVNILKKVS
jgi:FKBP-type peptidyl-prolyl cis-trans isomerase